MVVGAGPAGLTAAYALSKRKIPVTVLESDPTYVGGISRTVHFRGFSFDIGGHRFFSKSKQVEDLWTEILPHDMLERPRVSRILYEGQFYSYPLRPFEALTKLGLVESTRCMASYLNARMRPDRNPKSFEGWVSNQFGRRLFQIFFKTYTEKVWGISCKEISADWAAQRIRGLSLAKAIKNGLFPPRSIEDRRDMIKTLINTFRYPRKGPGMLWESCARKVTNAGGNIAMGRRMTQCVFDSLRRRWTVATQSADGCAESFTGEHVICSAPLRELVKSLHPAASEKARRSADALRYRDFLTVALMLRDRRNIPDNWIYVHDPRVKVGRIQNYKSWSPEMVPDPACCCYGLEYFCFEGDGLWESSDAELVALATGELQKLGMADAKDVFDGCVVRQRKAYPVYDDDYAHHVSVIREEIRRNYPGLHLIGRNGMHKYNNQDHAMMTALLTVENIVAGQTVYDVWSVNEDAEYHEAGVAAERSAELGVRLVPSRVRA